jgi:tetratricopeptide (TPR) repeat protein
MRNTQRGLFLLCALVLLAGCCGPDDNFVRSPKAIDALMDRAESIMDDDAPAADSLMHLIDASSIRSKKRHARYALIYTAAEYKSYQLLTSDSLIMDAVRYYSIRDNMDYRFLSYYYLGCAYLDMRQMTDASVAFAQAEQLADRIDNDYWKGLLYSRLGSYYYESCFFNRSEEYYLMAISCFERAGKKIHKVYTLSDYANSKMGNLDFTAADSILKNVGKVALAYGDSSLYENSLYNRLYCMVHLEKTDSAEYLVKKYSLRTDEQSQSQGYLGLMALYHSLIKDYSKSESFQKKAWNSNLSETDSIYMYYVSAVIAKSKGNIEESLELFRKYVFYENRSMRALLNHPVTEAQEKYFRTMAELESIKAHNRVTILITSIIISLLIISYIFLISLNRKRKTQQEIRDYLSTIEDLTAKESENQDKIISLNNQVREMLRQHFTPSDYLYTRYYEQIDDNKKAERLFRVVKCQIDQFTGPKSISRIDELLNKTFDGIMNKVLSSGLDLKDKELLLLRFALAGFSAKSMAAILGDTHVNITQRKKRLLDKIQSLDPNLMNDLRSALIIR